MEVSRFRAVSGFSIRFRRRRGIDSCIGGIQGSGQAQAIQLPISALNAAMRWSCRGTSEGALAEYREAARLAARARQLHEHIAQVFFVKGQLDLAVAEMQEQFRLYPQTSRDTFQRHSWESSTKSKARNAWLSPRTAINCCKVARRRTEFLRLALETTGTPEDVFRAYRDAVRSDPGDWQLQRTFLNVCLKLGMTMEVLSALEADISLLREKAQPPAKRSPFTSQPRGGPLSRRRPEGSGHRVSEGARTHAGRTQAECNEVAWTLAASSEANQRYGSIAVEFATRACELTDWKNCSLS